MTRGHTTVKLQTRMERWPLATPFRITGRTMTEIDVIVVQAREGELVGRGEAAGVSYRNDLPDTMLARLQLIAAQIENDPDRALVNALLPAGGARNAVDCALWELEAKRKGRAVWQLAGSAAPRALLTTWTIGADEPQEMSRRATRYSDARALKLKLLGDEADAERVRAVRAARPDVWLGVDANQGLTPRSLDQLMPVLVEVGVQLIEQPYPNGRERDLDDLDSSIPIAADESVQSSEDIADLVGRVDVLNIKLDKCGGLTEAMRMARAAREAGFKVMVGNMLGTSLAMAPAFIVGQMCDIVDLDGPLLLARDRSPSIVYKQGQIWCPEEVWGGVSRDGDHAALERGTT